MANEKWNPLSWVKELVPHALWDGLKEIYKWSAPAVAGAIVSLVERYRKGALFFLGICISATSLVLAILIGRWRSTRENVLPQSGENIAQSEESSLIRPATDEEVKIYDPKFPLIRERLLEQRYTLHSTQERRHVSLAENIRMALVAIAIVLYLIRLLRN